MNLLLLDADEIDDRGRATLADERAEHVVATLGADVGRELRIGQLDGPLGTAEVVSITRTPASVTLRCRLESAAPPRPADVLVLAVPRPIMLRRCIEHAAALGFGRIALIRTWRVEKSFLTSRAMLPAALRAAAIAGLAQARRTHVPHIERFARFKPFVEDALDGFASPTNRYVAHLEGADPIHRHPPRAAPLTLAIGPEGGFRDHEVDALVAVGFTPVHAGPHPLRVEAALPALHARLDLLRELAGTG